MGIYEIKDLEDYYDKLMRKEHKDCLRSTTMARLKK